MQSAQALQLRASRVRGASGGLHYHRHDPFLFAYAFRNYYWEPLATWALDHNASNLYLPLGPLYYAGPIKGAETVASRRRRLCFFAGAFSHGDRAQMLRAIQASHLPCAVSDNLQGVAYSQALADSVFAFAPWGNNPGRHSVGRNRYSQM